MNKYNENTKIIASHSNRYFSCIENKVNRIPKNFRPLCIKYIEKLLQYKDYSIKYIETDVMKSLEIFLNFISNQNTKWNDLTKLNRFHIEYFLHYYNNNYGQLEQKDRVYLQIIMKFIYHINIFGFEEAPHINSNKLLTEEDIPKKYYKSRKTNTVPTSIIKKLDSNIKYIKPEVHKDIIFIARKTGIQIADIINLKVESCLEQINNSYAMVTDIKRTAKKAYKIPITYEVADVLKKRIEYARALGISSGNLFFNNDSNVEITTASVIKSLNKLAEIKELIYLGSTFKFNAHMLRETRALEYLDAGLDINVVQQILGYSTSKTLLKYKEAKDNNMKKQWEKSNDAILKRIKLKNGTLQIRTFTENGECKNPDVKVCYRTLNPCLSCSCFHITKEFIEAYKYEINRLELFIERYQDNDTLINIDEHITLLKLLKEVLSKIDIK